MPITKMLTLKLPGNVKINDIGKTNAEKKDMNLIFIACFLATL